MDRGFNSVDNIPEMESLWMSYVMPLKGSDRLREILEEVDAGGDPVREYAMANKAGRRSTSTLVVCRKKNAKAADRYVAFITNIKMGNPGDLIRLIPRTYRRWWGIEVGYLVLKQVRAKTKSPRAAARLLLMFFSLAYANFWLFYRRVLISAGAGKAKALPIADYSDLLWLRIAARGRPP